MGKKSFHPTNLKGKKARQLECMLGLSHWLHEILSSQKRSSPFLASANTPYLFCFILISWGCLTSLTFSFHNEPIDWPIAKKKDETIKAPQNRRFYGKME
jgi:hypothetical protein